MKEFQEFMTTFMASARLWSVCKDNITVVGSREWDVKEWGRMDWSNRIGLSVQRLPQLLIELGVGRINKGDYALVLFVLDKLKPIKVHSPQSFMAYMGSIGCDMHRFTSADSISKVYRNIKPHVNEIYFLNEVSARTEVKRKYIAYVFLQLLNVGF